MSETEFTRRRRMAQEEMRGVLERRAVADSSLELRDAGDGFINIAGYAALFGNTYDVGPYRERIATSAFDRTLSELPDLVFNVDHGRSLSGLPLARTRSAKGGPGTLELSTDAKGLFFRAQLDATDPDAQAIRRAIRNGTMSQCSFAFKVNSDSWDPDRQLRTLKDVSLHGGDVSCVAFGANPETSISVRNAAEQARVQILPIDPVRRARERMALANRRASVRRQVTTVEPVDWASRYRRRIDEMRSA